MLSRGWARYLPWLLGALAAGLLTLPIVLHQCSASREGAATMVLAEAQRLGASWVASHPTAPEAPSREVLPAHAVEWSVEPGAAAAMLRFAGSLSAEQMQLMAAQRPMEASCFAAEQRRQLALAAYYAVGRGYGPPCSGESRCARAGRARGGGSPRRRALRSARARPWPVRRRPMPRVRRGFGPPGSPLPEMRALSSYERRIAPVKAKV